MQSKIQQSCQSIEFFHIYTDELISEFHTKSIEPYKKIQSELGGRSSSVVFIDNYNPETQVTTAEDVLNFLASQDATPDFWAFEADVVPAAQELLLQVDKPHLKRNYESYIKHHGKLPCSLLAAAWYLARLGRFDTGFIKSRGGSARFIPCQKVVNILPEFYKDVEHKAAEIIRHSPFKDDLPNIQNVFYATPNIGQGQSSAIGKT